MAPTISCSRRRARWRRGAPTSSSALFAWTRDCRSRPGSAAVRPMPARRCGFLRKPTGFARDDPRLYAAARATGADVPVCLDARRAGHARHRRAAVGAAFAAAAAGGAGQSRRGAADQGGLCRMAAGCGAGRGARPRGGRETDRAAISCCISSPRSRTIWKTPAIALKPVIAEVLAELRGLPGCQLARMSGSGATCFGLFATVGGSASSGKSPARQISTLVGRGRRVGWRPER